MKNRTKRLLASIICVCMIFTFLPAQAIAVDAQSTGTTSNTEDWSGYTPISTKEELNAIRSNSSGNYYLANDIVFNESDFTESGAFYNDGKGWLPVNSFSGILDGNGHVISGLYINSRNGYVGLFAQITGTIKNLGIIDSQITGDTQVGAFAGFAGTRSSIINCYNASTITATHQGDSAIAGGIVGDAGKAQITNCYNVGDIFAESDTFTVAAGIVGWGYACTVSECYNAGTVQAVAQSDCNRSLAAGIAGLGNKVLNSYNTGSISALNSGESNYCEASAGGITAANTQLVTNCYNVGEVAAQANNANVGAIGITAVSVTDCYYLDTVPADGSTASIRCTNEQMQEQSTFNGFDFTAVWKIGTNSEYSYPELRTLPHVATNDIEKSLDSIAVTSLPTKLTYLENKDALDVAGGKITLYYNNGSCKEMDMTTDMITGFDNTVLGSQTLTVEYEGFTDVYQVQILSEDCPKIIVSGGVAANNGVVVVTISLENNPGIASMRLKVDYDSSAMSLIGVSDLGKIGSEIHSDQFTDPYVLCWANDTVTENFTANGDIVNLTFKISDTAALGSYEISVSYDYDKYDIHNVQVEKVKFYTVAGSVDVVDVLIGDVNGDGSLDTLDRLTLSRYLANWQGYTIDDINTIGADVNCDGSIDTLDRLVLSRHLANWSGYEEITQ